MKSAIIIFPGTNREQDMRHALNRAGIESEFVFCNQKDLPENIQLVVLAGGFSYGDYLRTGVMAANSNIMNAVKEFAHNGGLVLGVCNGFQILCEAGLLEGVLMRNTNGRFICKTVDLKIENNQTPFTNSYEKGQVINIPIAHGEGNYFADSETLKSLEDNGQIVLRYTDNPNGSQNNIAGIINKKGNVLGMMPHPENHVDDLQKNQEGLGVFLSLLK